MFKIFSKKKKELLFGEYEKLFFKNIVNIIPYKYHYLKAQINPDFILGFKPNVLGYQDSYTFLLNAKKEKLYINKKLPHYFILRNIKVWNIKINDFCSIELDILHGILGGFKNEIIDFTSFDFNKIDVSEVCEKKFPNNDLDKLIKNFNSEEKMLIEQKLNDTYAINIPEGNFYYIENIGNGDILALDILGNVYLLIHDPYKIKKIFTKEDFFIKMKSNTLINDAIREYNYFTSQ